MLLYNIPNAAIRFVMSSLNDQLESFKAKRRAAPVLGKRIVDGGAEQPKKRILPAQNIPKPTVMNAHTGTQFVHAMEFLKEHEESIRFKDLENYLGSSIEPLLGLFNQHANVRVDMRDSTLTYVSKFDIYSGDDLLRYLNRQNTFTGVLVSDLKDGWSAAIPTINRLEQEDKILVVRNKKDESPRILWPNTCGPLGKVDKMFVDLWHAAKVPSTNDLRGTLESVGLKPSSVDPSKIKVNTKKKDGDKRKRRQHHGKFTNTHMRGVLKDYGS